MPPKRKRNDDLDRKLEIPRRGTRSRRTIYSDSSSRADGIHSPIPSDESNHSEDYKEPVTERKAPRKKKKTKKPRNERKSSAKDTANRLFELFRNLGQRENLSIITGECSIDPETGLRGKSQLVLDKVRGFIADLSEEERAQTEGCLRAEKACLYTILEHFGNYSTIPKIIPRLSDLLKALYQKPNTQSTFFSQFKGMLTGKYGKSEPVKEALDKFYPEKAVAILRKKDYEAKVYERNRNLREISDTKVLEIINSNRFSEDWECLMIVVGLAVGSRKIEIIRRSKFEKTDKDDPHWIKITGVAKERAVRGQPLSNERMITKPIVGLTNLVVLELVAKIRRKLNGKYGWDLGDSLPDGTKLSPGIAKSNESIGNTLNHPLSEMVHTVLGPDYHFHDTRAIYAEMAWTFYAPSAMSKVSFYSQILGHKETSLTTALSYQKFAARRQLREEDPEMRSELKTLFARIEALEQKLEENQLISNPRFVKFINSKGKSFVLERLSIPRGKEQKETRWDQLIRQMRVLVEQGVEPTYDNFRKLGYGSNLIARWRQHVANSINLV